MISQRVANFQQKLISTKFIIIKLELSQIAEGYYATKSAYHLNQQKGKKKAKTPIIDAVYEILYENKDPRKTFKKLTEMLD